MATDQFLRWPQVHNLTGLSRSTVWRLERLDRFPKRRTISSRCVGWKLSEVQAWMDFQQGLAELSNGCSLP